MFGTTTNLFLKYLGKFGLEVTFVDLVDMSSWEQAVQPNTRMLFCETPSNPICEVADLSALSTLAKAHDCLFVVDNCFCTPALQKPLEFGADLVIHSATKYLDGQGRCVGGCIVGANQYIDEIVGFLRTCGPTMSPFNAWVFLKGLETLRLRMDAHCSNAMALAQWLEQQADIEKVYYAGLDSHTGKVLATKQQRGYGGVMSFQVKGDREAAWRFIDATRICSLTANLGDVKTTIIHPATTTHGRLTAQQRIDASITDNLIRVAVGLEDIDDLKADMQRGLDAL